MKKIILSLVLLICVVPVIANQDFLLYFCESDSDCIIPPQCSLTTADCMHNQCSYTSPDCTTPQIENYLLSIKTIYIPQPQITGNYDSVIEFDAPIDVAGNNFVVRGINVLSTQCPISNGNYLDPNENNGCYDAHVQWMGYDFHIKNGETKELDNHVEVIYTLNSRGAYLGEKCIGGICDTYNYEFLPNDNVVHHFKLILKDIIEIEDIQYDTITKLNKEHYAKIKLRNNLKGDVAAEIAYTLYYGMLDNQDDTKYSSIYLKEGLNEKYFQLSTNQLGQNTYTLTPRLNLLGDKYFNAGDIEFEYFVGTTNVPSGYIPDQPDNPSPSEPEDKFPIIMVAGAFVLLLIILLIWRR